MRGEFFKRPMKKASRDSATAGKSSAAENFHEEDNGDPEKFLAVGGRRAKKPGAEKNHKNAIAYDAASIAYVSFDRVGHIERISLAAVKLLGVSRRETIGMPFASYVYAQDAHKFLRHLLSCRSHPDRVETELRLKAKEGAPIPVRLSSTPGSFSIKRETFLYPTIIVDLR